MQCLCGIAPPFKSKEICTSLFLCDACGAVACGAPLKARSQKAEAGGTRRRAHHGRYAPRCSRRGAHAGFDAPEGRGGAHHKSIARPRCATRRPHGCKLASKKLCRARRGCWRTSCGSRHGRAHKTVPTCLLVAFMGRGAPSQSRFRTERRDACFFFSSAKVARQARPLARAPTQSGFSRGLALHMEMCMRQTRPTHAQRAARLHARGGQSGSTSLTRRACGSFSSRARRAWACVALLGSALVHMRVAFAWV